MPTVSGTDTPTARSDSWTGAGLEPDSLGHSTEAFQDRDIRALGIDQSEEGKQIVDQSHSSSSLPPGDEEVNNISGFRITAKDG